MTIRPRPRSGLRASFSIGNYGSRRFLHRSDTEDRLMEAIDQLEKQIERRESLHGFNPNPGRHQAEETKYHFLAKRHQVHDPDFAVVRTSNKTAVVTFFMESGKLRPVTKELPLDEALKIADQMNRGEK